MEEYLKELMKFGTYMLWIIMAVALILYAIQAILLSDSHKLKYGKNSLMAWIPGLNLYIMGKVLLNRWFGLIVFICFFLTGKVNIIIDGVEKQYNLLPDSILSMITPYLGYILVALYVLTIINYKMLVTRGEKNKDDAITLTKKRLVVPNKDNTNNN